MATVARIVSVLIAGAWFGLLFARARFWDPPCDGLCAAAPSDDAPEVHAIVPARDEAAMLASTLPALLATAYAGRFRVTLADDGSSDGTAELALGLAHAAGAADRFTVVRVPPRPAGWSGKVWAMAAAVADARAREPAPAYWFFTDADVVHDSTHVARLVATARAEALDLISALVELSCRSAWEKLLIPAFVFFFCKLYPFAWVADERRRTAAAAGGCMLISNTALQRIGGIERIANALIDDCALAAAVKDAGGRMRLALTTQARSIRPYNGLPEIWRMVARSAYTQLRQSPVLLAATVMGMLALYVVPPVSAVAGVRRRDPLLALSGAAAWAMLSFAYVPILRRYRRSPVLAPLLPLSALLYTAMTADSARRHARGHGGAWKGRTVTKAPPPCG
ncbi:MAG: glycosyltransferase [Candidatus Velthaea sp.]